MEFAYASINALWNEFRKQTDYPSSNGAEIAYVNQVYNPMVTGRYLKKQTYVMCGEKEIKWAMIWEHSSISERHIWTQLVVEILLIFSENIIWTSPFNDFKQHTTQLW